MRRKIFIARLKKPDVIICLVTQMASLMVLFGANINETFITSVAAALCAIFGALGILSSDDYDTNSRKDRICFCPGCREYQRHVLVCGHLTCTECGATEIKSK